MCRSAITHFFADAVDTELEGLLAQVVRLARSLELSPGRVRSSRCSLAHCRHLSGGSELGPDPQWIEADKTRLVAAASPRWSLHVEESCKVLCRLLLREKERRLVVDAC